MLHFMLPRAVKHCINLVIRDIGKLRLADDKTVDVTGMGGKCKLRIC